MPHLARGGLLAFAGLVVLMHVLRPGLDPAERFVSEYGRGWTQPLMIAAFLAWAVGTAACVAVARRTGGERRVARGIVVAALCVAALGLVVAAAFASQTVGGELPENVRRTTAGRLHDIGTLCILAGLLVAAPASTRLLRSGRYRWTVAGLAVVLLGIVPVLVAVGADAPGIGQRGFILVGLAWQWAFVGSAAPRLR